jgi:hypothetical protein
MTLTCDNCGEESNRLAEHERLVTNVRLGWPPIEHVRVTEMWCDKCRYVTPGTLRASQRRKHPKRDPDADD